MKPHDVLLLLAALLFVAGAALIYRPLGLLVGGAAAGVAWLLLDDRGSRR